MTFRSSRTVRARALLLGVVCACLSAAAPTAAQEQRFADIGDFRLESGETIRNCRIGYRTAGRLDADRRP